MKYIFMIMALSFLLVLSGCKTGNGSVIFKENFNNTRFEIEFNKWSNKQTCKMNLDEGDQVKLDIACDKGSVLISISDSSGASAYRGNDLSDEQFIVKALSTDEHIICLEGRNASGKVIIERSLTR